ncbi:hypothetical protein LCGC14_1465720 [marine sediment metagenome]|uniref:Uncharacterized protein n=1 Tax=marine sediment metagenome TaxID=412755 RepID=A0A0F9MFR2_9ZZZZ
MPEKEKKKFTYTQLAELLVKESDIHEGYWGLFLEFGLGGANLPIADPDGQMVLRPAAIIPVSVIGIQEFGGPNPLTVDAAEVNPKPKGTSKRRKKTGSGTV